MRLGTWLAIASVAACLATHPMTVFAQTLVVDRPAEIRGGTCAGPAGVVTPLAHLVLTTGEIQGQTGATPVEQSGTVVPLTIGDLLAAPHAVVVLKSPQEAATVVACGEVGGALNPDGTLAVGMSGMNGSGLSGVAYFTPIDTFNNTLVTILLVGGESAAGAPAVSEADPVEIAPAPPGQPAQDGTSGAGAADSGAVASD